MKPLKIKHSNIRFLYGNTASLSSQQGATLIVVLMVLLLITVIGVLAIRTALTSLNISTNSQINQLLWQAADTPNNILLRSSPKTVAELSRVTGAALGNQLAGEEYIFCYKPKSSNPFGMLLNSAIIKASTANNSAEIIDGSVTSGFCDVDTDFGSDRQAVVTQIAITRPTDPDTSAAPGAYLARGTDASEGSILPKGMVSRQRMRMTTTAMLPAYATDNIEDNCMSAAQARISDNEDKVLQGKETLAQCVARYGVPVSTQMQEFAVFTMLEETVSLVPGG